MARRLLLALACASAFAPCSRGARRVCVRAVDDAQISPPDDDAPPAPQKDSKLRDFFEPRWDWLQARRQFAEVVRAGRRAEAARLARGQLAIEKSISSVVKVQNATRIFLEDEWKREEELRSEAWALLEKEWERERKVANATQIFLGDEWKREEELRRETRKAATAFVADEWEREEELRQGARAFLADEFERLEDADEELAARIRGAPQLTVCTAPIACGKANGRLVYDRLAALAAGEADAGRPAPLVRCATKCASNCRAGKVAVTLGAPRREIVYCDATPPPCEDPLGYCNLEEAAAAADAAVDRQLDSIIARGRASTRKGRVR